MKKVRIILTFTLLVLITSSCSDKVSAPETHPYDLASAQKQVVTSTSQFGIDLLKEINKNEQDKNIFISPFSVSTAFGMLLNGADGKTYEEIKSVLKLSGGTGELINSAYKNLNEYLPSADQKVNFEIANSIWFSNILSFEQSFFEVNKTYFNSLVQGLNFSDEASAGIINNWVSDKTGGKIKNLIDRLYADDVMVLVNAIYFNGTWHYSFDSSATKSENFYLRSSSAVKCMMMSQKDSLNYFATDSYQAVELPYGSGNFGMLIILPFSDGDVNELISGMDPNFFDNLSNNMRKKSVNIWLPKFSMDYSIQLEHVLSEMGMKSVFEQGTADLSKIRKENDLFVSRVIHKTFIKLDEQGTEAAASTAIIISRSSSTNSPSQEKYMRVDHPFILCIRENQTGTILFLGKVMNPGTNLTGD